MPAIIANMKWMLVRRLLAKPFENMELFTSFIPLIMNTVEITIKVHSYYSEDINSIIEVSI